MPRKGEKQKRYSAEFKIGVIMDMREHHLGYCETARKYELGDPNLGGVVHTLRRWERIYLEEGAEGLMKERRICLYLGFLDNNKKCCEQDQII